MAFVPSFGTLRASGLGALESEAELDASYGRAIAAAGELNSLASGGVLTEPSGCPESKIMVFAGACDSGNLGVKIFRADLYERARSELAQLTTPPTAATWNVRELYLKAVQMWGTVAYAAAALRRIWAKPSFATGGTLRAVDVAVPQANWFGLFTVNRNLGIVLDPIEPQASDGTGSANVLIWSEAEATLHATYGGEDRAHDVGAWHTEMLRRLNSGPRPERFGWHRILERNDEWVEAVMASTCKYQNTPCFAADGCWHNYLCSRKVKMRSGGYMVAQATQWARYIAERPFYMLLLENGEAYLRYLQPFVDRGEIGLTPDQFREKMTALARARATAGASAGSGAASTASTVSVAGGAMLALGAGLYTLLANVLPMAAGWSCPVPMYTRTLSGECSTSIDQPGGAGVAYERGAAAAARVALPSPIVKSLLTYKGDTGPAPLTTGQKATAAVAGAIVVGALAYVLFK